MVTLDEVKLVLGITGNHFDTQLTLLFNEVKEYLRSAGVLDAVIESDVSKGAIIKGVADLWEGNDLSDYFYQRADQLRGVRS